MYFDPKRPIRKGNDESIAKNKKSNGSVVLARWCFGICQSLPLSNCLGEFLCSA